MESRTTKKAPELDEIITESAQDESGSESESSSSKEEIDLREKSEININVTKNHLFCNKDNIAFFCIAETD